MMTRSIAFAVLVLAASAAPAADPERYRLRGESDLRSIQPLGSGATAESELPFDKPFSALTAAQQRQVKAAYVKMGDADEPPFPVAGLQAIYKPITAGQQRGLDATGTFRGEVEIDETGAPIAFAVYESPDASVTRFVANIVMLTRFKPALCEGSPCRMGFPVRITFKTR